MEHEHTAEAIRERLQAGPSHSYIRDFVYGGIDGSVTTFAVVSGVVGAQLSSVIILILGFANLVADGFSMAASNYLGTRTEQDDLKRLEAIEYNHIAVAPQGEREEIRQIFHAKGFRDNELERIVDLITADQEKWVRTMLSEEYGLPLAVRSPILAALSTFSAFMLCGLAPLIPYLFGTAHSFRLSIFLTGVVFFFIGAFKSKWSTSPWWRSGLETLIVGSVAASLAYAVGVLLRNLGLGAV